MKKIILNKQQVGELVLENRYPVAGNKFLSRCIDGRYENKLKVSARGGSAFGGKGQKLKVKEVSLPALALPGGDLGELALILATGNAFGFEVDGKKAFEVLVEIVGGEENFHFHTDEHHWDEDGSPEIFPRGNLVDSVTHEYSSRCEALGSPSATQSASCGSPSHFVPPTKFTAKSHRCKPIPPVRCKAKIKQPSPFKGSGLSLLKVLNGCGHWKQIQADPPSYDLQESDVNSLRLILSAASSKISQPWILHGEHQEGAILIVKGNFGIYPRFLMKTEEGVREVEVFVFQQSLVDQRHRILSKKLLEKKAVKLFPGCDEEYLYEVLSEEAEVHLFETAKRLAVGLPIFAVDFKDDGSFVVEERGEVG